MLDLSFIRRYVQFCVVGLTGLVVDMVVLHILASPNQLGLGLTVSKFIAAEVALINNFLWNETWTFRGRGPGGSLSCWARFAKFNIICTLGIVFSVLLLQAQVALFGVNIYIANFVAIFIVSIWNFSLNARFSWSRSS